MKFPSDFIEKYKDLLGAEAEEFFTLLIKKLCLPTALTLLKSSRRTILILFLEHLGAITVNFRKIF